MDLDEVRGTRAAFRCGSLLCGGCCERVATVSAYVLLQVKQNVGCKGAPAACGVDARGVRGTCAPGAAWLEVTLPTLRAGPRGSCPGMRMCGGAPLPPPGVAAPRAVTCCVLHSRTRNREASDVQRRRTRSKKHLPAA